MKRITGLFLLLFILQLEAKSQTSIELLASLGPTFTSPISYRNCTGHLDPVTTFSISFVYHPSPLWGLQLNISSLNPTSYLNDPLNGSVEAYTNSTISIQRFLAGINYSPSFQRIHPFIGCLLGFSVANTTQAFYTSYNTSFSWALQSGIDYYFSHAIGLRLNGAIITTPGIANNTAYFNVDKYGSRFPSFAIGDPSTANIIQWNIGIGIIIRFIKK